MGRPLQHKRFMLMNDTLSSLRCYWYVQHTVIVPIGNESDSDARRPDHVHT